MTKTFVSIAAAAFATAAIFASPAAYAADAKVSFGDLNLTTNAGQATLERRIDAASHTACDAINVTGSRIDRAADCRQQVRREITAQLQSRLAAQRLAQDSRVAFGN